MSFSTLQRAGGFPKHGALAIALTVLVISSYLLFRITSWNQKGNVMIIEENLLVSSLTYFCYKLLRWIQEQQQHLIGIHPAVAYGIGYVIIPVLLFITIVKLGLRQFGGYDYSDLIESAWIQLGSFAPFRDYPCTKPPFYFFAAKLSFIWFGIRWVSFPIITGIFGAATYLFLFRQFRSLGLRYSHAVFLALLVEIGTNVISSFWSYNPTTSTITVMVLVSVLVCLQYPEPLLNFLLLTTALTLSILSKPNSWPIIACLFPLLISPKKIRIRTILVIFVSICLAALACWVFRLPPLEVLRTYSKLGASRGSPFSLETFLRGKPAGCFLSMYATYLVARKFGGYLFAERTSIQIHWREFFCCVVAGLTALEMALTNFESLSSNLMPLIIAFFLAAYRPWHQRMLSVRVRVFVMAMLTFTFVSSAYSSITRDRVRSIGEGVFFEVPATEKISSGFFAGLHTGPEMIKVLDQLQGITASNPRAKFFFGPRIEFAYAAFRQAPPRGLPIWWHPGSSYFMADLPRVQNAFIENSFDILVFLKDDRTGVPDEIVAYILKNYELVGCCSELSVFQRRQLKFED